MRVNVEDCWCGGNKWKWRLEFTVYGATVRECIYHEEGESWNRSTARLAKDIISENYGVSVSSIRFSV